jgi:hypothetical protein
MKHMEGPDIFQSSSLPPPAACKGTPGGALLPVVYPPAAGRNRKGGGGGAAPGWADGLRVPGPAVLVIQQDGSRLLASAGAGGPVYNVCLWRPWINNLCVCCWQTKYGA